MGEPQAPQATHRVADQGDPLEAQGVKQVNQANRMGERFAQVAQAPSGLDAMDLWVEISAEVTPSVLLLATRLDTARRVEPTAAAVWKSQMDDGAAGTPGSPGASPTKAS